MGYAPPLRIVRAEAFGMCFGVRDALALARAVDRPADVAIHGELVHNRTVLDELARLGFATIGEHDRDRELPPRPKVMITAHGVSDAERARLERAGKQIIDTTCPLVRRAHTMARALGEWAGLVVVVGRRGHVEVSGLTGDLERFVIVETPDEVRAWGEPRLGVVFQTTTAPALAAAVLERIEQSNSGGELRGAPTICRPTLDRQAALRRLLGQVEAVVVVGGRHSNNTKELAAAAQAAGKPALHVEAADEVDAAWLERFGVVGLTAGTSTPPEVIAAVEARLNAIAGARRLEATG